MVASLTISDFEDHFDKQIPSPPPAEKMLIPGLGYSRAVSEVFITNLVSGMLLPFLERVRDDDTLMLALRGTSVNIYYRGGSLFKIVTISEVEGKPEEAVYRVVFDQNYNAGYAPLAREFPVEVRNSEAARRLVEDSPFLKFVMDRYFSRRRKPEREFQQLVVRENNRSAISHETDYFIVDIELAGILPGTRYDMLAVRWLDSNRAGNGKLVPALIEMKYGDNSIEGTSGMAKHLDDVCTLIENPVAWGQVVAELQKILQQLHRLKLLEFSEGKKLIPLSIVSDSKPEFIFLLTNYNPRSSLLKRFLAQAERSKVLHPGFNLLFFVSCFAGYGMHRASMMRLDEFEAEVTRLHQSKSV